MDFLSLKMNPTENQNIYMIIASVIVGGVSVWVKHRNSNNKKADDIARNKNKHTETILGGYSKIVEDLQGEVERLNDVIADLRKEQEECERRNEAMAKVVEELRRRVAHLEGDSRAR